MSLTVGCDEGQHHTCEGIAHESLTLCLNIPCNCEPCSCSCHQTGGRK